MLDECHSKSMEVDMGKSVDSKAPFRGGTVYCFITPSHCEQIIHYNNKKMSSQQQQQFNVVGSNPVQNCMVIGGAGFLGQHLVEDLMAKGYNVSVMDIREPSIVKNVKFYKGDICDKEVSLNSSVCSTLMKNWFCTLVCVWFEFMYIHDDDDMIELLNFSHP